MYKYIQETRKGSDTNLKVFQEWYLQLPCLTFSI